MRNVPLAEWTWRVNGKESVHCAPVTEVGIVVVEPVNAYLCPTYMQIIDEKVAHIVPTLQRYRGLGLTVLFALPPVYVKAYYDQHIQRPGTRITHAEGEAIRDVGRLVLPPYPWKYDHGHCSCNQNLPICRPSEAGTSEYLHPMIQLGARDLIVQNHYELYTYCVGRGIKYLFYIGFSVDQCILHRTYGVCYLIKLGLTCAVIRDLVGHHITDKRFSDEDGRNDIEQGLAAIVGYIEQHVGPTLLSHQVYLQGGSGHGV